MNNRYQILKSLENFNKLISMGILSIHLFDWIVIYEYYLIERQTNKKLQSYSNTAEQYKIGERHVMRVVSWMEGY